MIFDYILTVILAIIVNVLVTKPFANLLDFFLKRNRSVLLEDNLQFNEDKNGKLGSDNNINNDIIVLTNVAFEQLDEKQLTKDTYIENLDKNNNTI